jgi:hypothetical protein
MIWKRRGRMIGVLILAQLGIVACYLVTQSGNAAPLDPPAAVAQTEKAAGPAPCPAPVVPITNLPAGTAFPIAVDGTVPPPVTVKTPPPTVSEDSVASGKPLETKEPAPAVPEKKAEPALPAPPAPSAPAPGGNFPLPAAPAPPPEPPAPSVVPAFPADRSPQAPGAVSPPTSPANPVPNPTPPAPAPVEKAAVPVRCPWILRVEIVEGRTQLTAETSKDIQFRLSCERLNLQAPDGTIEAHGAVKLSSPGIEGTCELLTITWQDDHVVLKGQAQMKCRRDGQDLELKSDQLSLRLSGARIVNSSPAEESEPPAVDRRSATRIFRAKQPRSDD